MAPETFDFSSFSLRSLHVSDFFKKDLHHCVFVDKSTASLAPFGPQGVRSVVIPAMSGGATPAEEVEHPGCFVSRKKSPS